MLPQRLQTIQDAQGEEFGVGYGVVAMAVIGADYVRRTDLALGDIGMVVGKTMKGRGSSSAHRRRTGYSTLTSVTAIVDSMLVFGWVGLAQLGF